VSAAGLEPFVAAGDDVLTKGTPVAAAGDSAGVAAEPPHAIIKAEPASARPNIFPLTTFQPSGDASFGKPSFF